ncbi:DegQ family serine endoprotease [Pseudovibrio exalbescens]|uniref:DegQ family serine endoprotease n=1 Tax=Pseudovibrio exalbescens TaxID=197461 RepID=UPI0023660F03|nr:DegQ family serine endoprotease [Pseudovibrio exalbescens]MDD7910644.1 DegQ family serine endoprotease [Pseudovibrio exalbescens]
MIDFRASVTSAAVAVGVLLSAAFGVSASAHAEQVVPSNNAEVQLSFAPLVKKVAPAVVNVYATRTVEQRQRISPFFDDPFFRRFFGDRGGFGEPRTRKRVQNSLGSGVIISDQGIIITNHHVIQDADEVRVALSDRREFDAEIVLKDERTDLAVLKIKGEGDNFPYIPFADSDQLEVGDLVLAIGNPFGVGQTVTQGIVSAVARTQVGVSDYQFFIQTDAAINPGNSGGALIDVRGNLVGINTAIFSRSGGSNGIGFAIPANMVKVVAAAAGDGDYVRRPWIGASLQPVSSDIALGLGLDRPRGVLVTRIFPDSPAERAGLEVGDLIVSVGENEINDPDSFGYRLATRQIGSEATFRILRGSDEVALDVALEAAPESIPRDTRDIGGRSPFSGATVMNLSPAVAEELRVPDEYYGVVIADIENGSNAQYIGLRRGDIIVAINGVEIDNTRVLERAARQRPRGWLLEIRRDGRLRRLSVRG